MAKKLIFVTAIALKRNLKMVNFMLVGLDNRKIEFRKLLKFRPKKFKIRCLYNLGSKWLQRAKKPKHTKNNAKIVKTSRKNNYNPPDQDLRWLGLG